VSATLWLGPPSRTRSENCNERFYRAAKADPGRRFHALYDKVYRRDVLERAWELVRANRGAAGIDRQTIAAVEEYGVAVLLDELAADLKEGQWRPLPGSPGVHSQARQAD
jgi:retron-type reverse transcriptase